ncbi:MAG: hypothetical protein DBX59_04820 [Bacillota bacterium]|nr:MAG: hypothetical protein DBX59_04820 [Bacillota bacterium]
MEPIKNRRESFETTKKVYESKVLSFDGVCGRDVYNCSIPFEYEGESYIFGRVEKRAEWANSVTYLFCLNKESGVWNRVENFDALPVEDPFITVIDGNLIVGGVHVVYVSGKIADYSTYFYKCKGMNPFTMRLYTSGPSDMKDIRLFQTPDGRIGVFSRPRNEEIRKQFGSGSIVGLVMLDKIEDLTPERIENAEYIHGMFGHDEWGGMNHAFYLKDNLVGAVGHQCYNDFREGVEYPVYINMMYIVDFEKHEVVEKRVIGTTSCYPDTPSKLPTLCDCAFTSGLVPEKDGKVRIYSGLRDCGEGYIVIDDPFRSVK